MSNDEQPPAWATALLHRITAMETRLPANAFNSPANSDLNVVFRTPGADFTPPETLLERYKYMELDFFRRPMEDSDRRRYLFECPKNTLRNYQPPKLNKVSLSQEFKQFDDQLHDIQYRLSGITRPMDSYAYQLSQGNWSQQELYEQSANFVHSIHELLSDLSSSITTMRTKNFYKGLPSKSDPPPTSTEDYLVDTKEMLDHLKLQQSVNYATLQRKRKNRPRPKRAHDGSAPSSQASVSATGSSTNTSGPSSPVPQPSTSRGFQQRSSPRRNP